MGKRGPKPRQEPEHIEVVREIADRIEQLREELLAAMIIARSQGATGEHLARASRLSCRTVYSRLSASVQETESS